MTLDSGDVNSCLLFVAAIADVAARRGDAERAARLAAGCATVRQPSSANWLDTYVPPWPGYLPLDGDRYARARQQGSELSFNALAHEALS